MHLQNKGHFRQWMTLHFCKGVIDREGAATVSCQMRSYRWQAEHLDLSKVTTVPCCVCGKWFVPCAAGNQITICCLNSFTSVEFLIKVISEEVFAVVISCTRCYHGNHRFRQINWSYSASEGLQIWESILNSSNKQTPPPHNCHHIWLKCR